MKRVFLAVFLTTLIGVPSAFAWEAEDEPHNLFEAVYSHDLDTLSAYLLLAGDDGVKFVLQKNAFGATLLQCALRGNHDGIIALLSSIVGADTVAAARQRELQLRAKAALCGQRALAVDPKEERRGWTGAISADPFDEEETP